MKREFEEYREQQRLQTLEQRRQESQEEGQQLRVLPVGVSSELEVKEIAKAKSESAAEDASSPDGKKLESLI